MKQIYGNNRRYAISDPGQHICNLVTTTLKFKRVQGHGPSTDPVGMGDILIKTFAFECVPPTTNQSDRSQYKKGKLESIPATLQHTKELRSIIPWCSTTSGLGSVRDEARSKAYTEEAPNRLLPNAPPSLAHDRLSIEQQGQFHTYTWRMECPLNSDNTPAGPSLPARRTQLTPAQLEQFWELSWALCTRTNIKGCWVYSRAQEEWNKRDQQPCSRCTDARTPRICKITIDHPCCQTCRDLKIGCDRWARFVFEHTKQDFINDYQSFLAVYTSKPPREMRTLKQTGNRVRRLLLQAPEDRPSVAAGPSVPYPPKRPNPRHKAAGTDPWETSSKKYILHIGPDLQVLKLQTVALKETAERIKTDIERTIAVESDQHIQRASDTTELQQILDRVSYVKHTCSKITANLDQKHEGGRICV
ncbi:hypothetical protein C8F04DRAFT_1198053 [Mycena alexandri]|uniref:Uncharacterized protein n=1 Tax=Mycena alexandri TaxID=1745969 RepID=A0AAD6WLY2_9AGAR|nr:hypothetical protein C8F04DRAFT_1198053 [Mycena alexandri]